MLVLGIDAALSSEAEEVALALATYEHGGRGMELVWLDEIMPSAEELIASLPVPMVIEAPALPLNKQARVAKLRRGRW